MTDDNRWLERCSRFTRCSVNCCPLDPRAERRPCLAGDPEQSCGASVRERLEIDKDAKKAGVRLPWGGLTKAEATCGRPVEELLAEDDARRAKRAAAQADRLGKMQQTLLKKRGSATSRGRVCDEVAPPGGPGTPPEAPPRAVDRRGDIPAMGFVPKGRFGGV